MTRPTSSRLTRREMLTLSVGLAAGSILAASMPVALEQTPVAEAQGPVALSVYDPTGAIEVTQLFSPRLGDLNGKTVCEVGDGMWEDARTFPVIRALLQKQFPTIKIIPYDKVPYGVSGYDFAKDGGIGNPKLVEILKGVGCQAAIVGNAG